MELNLLGWGDAGWGDELARGAVMTLVVAACAFALSIVFGTVFAAAKLAPSRILRLIGDVYTTVLRGIPELLVIYLVFFGGAQILASVASGLFGYDGRIELPVFVVGVFCIGLSSGAYSTEVIRGAVASIPRGQIEAAQAVGMRRAMRFRRILVPQAARFALPGMTNIWQLALKDTSLISVVGLAEIMFVARQGAGSTREPFTFYIAAFFLFLFLAWLSQRLFNRAETWAERGVRRGA